MLDQFMRRDESRRRRHECPRHAPVIWLCSLVWIAASGQTISGTVVREDTDAPLAGAKVQLQPRAGGAMLEATTSAEGRFAFADRTPGPYILRAEIKGYPGMVTQFVFATNPVRYSGVDGTTPDLVIRVAPACAISGRVLSADGKPVSGAQVRALRLGYTRTGRDLFPSISASSNGTGEYRLEGLQPGRYYLAVRSMSPPPSVSPYFYYPAVTEFSKAAAVEVAPDQDQAGIDVRVSKPNGVRVSGHAAGNVFDRGAPPIAFLIRRGPVKEEIGATVILRDGGFAFEGVPPGSYTIKGTPQLGSRDVEVQSSNVGNVELAAYPPITVSGRVRGDMKPGMKLILIPDDGSAVLASTAADGSFTFKDVAPGKYSLRLAIREAAYLAAAKLAGKDVLDAGLDLTLARSAVAGLDIAMNAQAGRIEGKALGAKRHSAGIVYVSLIPDPPDRQRWSLYRSMTTDVSGAFTLVGIAPGKYKMFAWKQLDPAADQNPEFLAPFESRGQAVTVTASGKLIVELNVLR